LLENHANLSQKAFFSVCGWDPRRDDGLLLEKLLKEEGTETKLDVNPGLPHGFWTTCPELPVSRNWEQKLVDGLRWILNRSE
jgi:acetyl esterase/lipase